VNPIERLKATLRRLESERLLRRRERGMAATQSDGSEAGIDVCSNDYLGYARALVSRETMGPTGAGASRLIHGTKDRHRELEQELSRWVGSHDSLLFSSGYAANVGVLAALAGPSDLIVSDELNHASLIDGCRLSRARVIIVPHRDVAAVDRALASGTEDGSAWVVTETYFSMDGDSPDLRRLRQVCDRHDAGLYVDEAHALGVFGPEGAGMCRDAGVVPDVLMGTLGKAIGVQGAFAAGSTALVDFLWNRARSFVFSTGTSPLLAELALGNVRKARADEASRARLRTLGSRLRERLGSAVPPDCLGPIFPILLGTPDRALRAVDVLRDSGFQAVAIRPPTVPPGRCRLRISLNATLTDRDLLRLGDAIERCLES
jgi:8-amino-7-oxononanoate synthase